MRTSADWPAEQLAGYARDIADADVIIDRLALILRLTTAEVGEQQGLANVTSLIMRDYPEPMMQTGLMMAMLRRIGLPVHMHSCTVCGDIDQPGYQHQTSDHDTEKEQ